MKVSNIAIILALLVSPVARGQSLQEIKQLENVDQVITLIDEAQVKLSQVSLERKTDCLEAVGIDVLCACLNDELPMVWSFADYVAIVSRDREANGYEKMDAGLKLAYDKVEPIRNQCVAKSKGS